MSPTFTAPNICGLCGLSEWTFYSPADVGEFKRLGHLSAMDNSCHCTAVGQGVQIFRIRDPRSLFDVVADLGSDNANFMEARAVWECRRCSQRFAWMRILFSKDYDEVLVRAESADWRGWDWSVLADIAEGCRWRSPDLDKRYVV